MEPMKKKKTDNMLNAVKIQRKIKNIEKEIKRLDKKGRILKPILEIEGDMEIFKNLEERKRNQPKLSDEENDHIINVRRQWSRHMMKQHLIEQKNYKILMTHQMNALEELRSCSEELYQSAIQVDLNSFPMKSKGLVSGFLDNYESPDGDYKDCTLNYKYEVEVDKRLLVKTRNKN